MLDTTDVVAAVKRQDSLPGMCSTFAYSRTLLPGGKKGSASGARLKYHTKYCAVTTCSQNIGDFKTHTVRECITH